MSPHYHAILWIDHREAKILRFNATDATPTVIESHATGRHAQHKANISGSGHRGVDTEFFARVATALADVGALLIAGPGTAKTELKHYIEERSPQLAKKISGIEPMDHASDGALLALARKFFNSDDRMHAQIEPR